jgi:hypothetical protein
MRVPVYLNRLVRGSVCFAATAQTTRSFGAIREDLAEVSKIEYHFAITKDHDAISTLTLMSAALEQVRSHML